MATYTNLTRDPLRRGAWCGHGGGMLFEIYKSTRSDGNYIAYETLGHLKMPLMAWTLASMDAKLRGLSCE